MTVQQIHLESAGQSRALSFRLRAGKSPRLLWLGGFKSDMMSSKALALEAWAAEHGQSYLRFDYSGHGESTSEKPGERFIDGTISRWLADALAMAKLDDAPLLIIGSSMGGWLALLLAQILKNRIKGMVLIAPAADFTEKLMWPQFSPQIRAEIETNGVWYRPNSYGEPYPITKALIEDGRKNQIMDAPIEVSCPVHILQGALDPDVPLAHTLKIMQLLPQDQTTLTIVQDGDHRLSRDQDIALLLRSVEQMLNELV